uniref:Uncharacterized protein n=1 Tax=Anopheles melas TaxID=34690 RepID=A0A182TN54_9DIPT
MGNIGELSRIRRGDSDEDLEDDLEDFIDKSMAEIQHGQRRAWLMRRVESKIPLGNKENRRPETILPNYTSYQLILVSVTTIDKTAPTTAATAAATTNTIALIWISGRCAGIAWSTCSFRVLFNCIVIFDNAVIIKIVIIQTAVVVVIVAQIRQKTVWDESIRDRQAWRAGTIATVFIASTVVDGNIAITVAVVIVVATGFLLLLLLLLLKKAMDFEPV